MSSSTDRPTLLRRVTDRPAVLVAAGVAALLVAGLLAYVTVRDTVGPGAEPAAAATAPALATHRVVSRSGGFAVAAPRGMRVTKPGRAVRLVGRDRALVVTVAPGPRAALRTAHERMLGEVSRTYRRVEMLATERTRIDGHPALTSSGLTRNDRKVPLRFVVVTVAARPRTFTITAFAARDAAPATVLPRVNAVVEGFTVRPAGARTRR